eukprot:TRINITY_DN4260_c0_g1_i3.p1 TRINITY_DN4260_c0_g1~~TRINITY_DN4260_c0_g1_i3.p1  ORF type:complete len:282 (-),score=55.94 TRINITY_DN4260_c0_g1_i3:717-1562(-)
MIENKHIEGSPFSVEVRRGLRKTLSHSTTEARGVGLISAKCFLDKPNVFTIFPKDGEGDLFLIEKEDISVDIAGNKKPKVDIFDNQDGTFDVEWTPLYPDTYKINVLIKGKQIEHSPFSVTISNSSKSTVRNSKLSSAGSSKITGFGLDASKIEIGQLAAFTIIPLNEDGSPLDISKEKIFVKITGPGNPNASIYFNDDIEKTYDVEWEPKEEGSYHIEVKIDGQSIAGSPFDINLVPKTQEKKKLIHPQEASKQNVLHNLNLILVQTESPHLIRQHKLRA